MSTAGTDAAEAERPVTTIEDVAREAGVSTATVSRALRGLPRVSNATRELVLATAARLDYVASPHAVGLAGGRSNSVAVIVPNVSRWFFGTVIHGAEDLLRRAGYNLQLYNITGDPSVRRHLFTTQLRSKRVDAVMVLTLQPSAEERAALRRTGYPTVLVGAEVEDWESVRIDDVQAALKAMQHLIGLGHTDIAHIGGSPDEFHAGLRFSAPQDRVDGYRTAMRRAGLRVARDWLVTSDFTARAGYAACQQLLGARKRPTAIFAASDEMAIGAAHAVRQAGLSVPGDVSIVGIDGHELSEYFGLTTVAQPAELLGRIGAQKLLDSLVGGTPSLPSKTVLPTELLVRHTTAPPPAR